MSTNHRTLPKLMNTMNVIFQDTFSERHHLLPGPWHAESQDLDLLEILNGLQNWSGYFLQEPELALDRSKWAPVSTHSSLMVLKIENSLRTYSQRELQLLLAVNQHEYTILMINHGLM